MPYMFVGIFSELTFDDVDLYFYCLYRIYLTNRSHSFLFVNEIFILLLFVYVKEIGLTSAEEEKKQNTHF